MVDIRFGYSEVLHGLSQSELPLEPVIVLPHADP